ALLQLLRYPRRCRRRRHRAQRGKVHDRGALLFRRLEGPEEAGERALLLNQVERAARIVVDGDDLAAVADDTGVLQMPFDGRPLVLGGKRAEIEAVEGGTEIVALAQDRQPRQARLKAFQAELLEQADVVGDGTAPFLVMVALVIRQAALPCAAANAVLARDEPACLGHRPNPSFTMPRNRAVTTPKALRDRGH